MSDDPIARWNALVESIQRPMQERIDKLESDNQYIRDGIHKLHCRIQELEAENTRLRDELDKCAGMCE